MVGSMQMKKKVVNLGLIETRKTPGPQNRSTPATTSRGRGESMRCCGEWSVGRLHRPDTRITGRRRARRQEVRTQKGGQRDPWIQSLEGRCNFLKSEAVEGF